MSKHQEPEHTPTPEELAAGDEPVHVPKGQSRARFLIILGLMIFTLVIYVVPSEFTQFFRASDPGETSYVTWQHPTDGPQTMGGRDFVGEKRKLQNLLYAIGANRMNDFLEDEQVGRMLVLDRLALDAGIQITDNELRQTIRDGGFIVLSRPSAKVEAGFPEFFLQVPPFGDAATFARVLDSVGTTAVDFQETLRTLLRIERYESMLSLAAQPRPADIESAWKKAHQQYGFELVTFDVEAAAQEVASRTADEATLRGWFDALDANTKRTRFSADWVAERTSAELLIWNLADTAEPTKLLEKFPLMEGVDTEALAKDYYNQFANVRFRRAEENAAGATAAERLYKPYEEVADLARRESRIHRALVDYSADAQMRLRSNLTSDQLALEAAEFGLAYVRDDEPRTQADWSTYPGVGDAMLAERILRASRSDRFIPLYVGPTSIVFGRTLTRVEASAPAYEAVADKVLVEWRKDQSFELANSKAQQLFEACVGTANTPEALVIDSATFAAKAQAQGATVVDAGWIDEADLTGDSVDNPTERDHFLRELAFSGRTLLRLADSTVGAPLVASDRSRIFVARKVGVRDPESIAIEPREFQQLAGQASLERSRDVRDQLIGLKGLEARYGLSFPGRRKPETPPPTEPTPKS